MRCQGPLYPLLDIGIMIIRLRRKRERDREWVSNQTVAFSCSHLLGNWYCGRVSWDGFLWCFSKCGACIGSVSCSPVLLKTCFHGKVSVAFRNMVHVRTSEMFHGTVSEVSIQVVRSSEMFHGAVSGVS